MSIRFRFNWGQGIPWRPTTLAPNPPVVQQFDWAGQSGRIVGFHMPMSQYLVPTTTTVGACYINVQQMIGNQSQPLQKIRGVIIDAAAQSNQVVPANADAGTSAIVFSDTLVPIQCPRNSMLFAPAFTNVLDCSFYVAQASAPLTEYTVYFTDVQLIPQVFGPLTWRAVP